MLNIKNRFIVVIIIVIIIIINIIQNKMFANTMTSFVYYDGKKYLQTEYIKIDKINETKENIIGEYIGLTNEWFPKDTGYGTINNVYKDLDSNIKGEIYTVQGYNKDFRICIVDILNSSIIFFENTDDIVEGMKGKELYKDIFNLKENFTNIEYKLQSDLSEENSTYKELVNITNKDVNKFITSLYDAVFIKLNEQIVLNPAQLNININMKDGTIVQLKVFINGYVMYRNYFLKIDDAIAEKLFDATEIKGQFSKLDIDESKYQIYTHVTFLNQVHTYAIIFACVIIGIIFIYIIKIIYGKVQNKG